MNSSLPPDPHSSSRWQSLIDALAHLDIFDWLDSKLGVWFHRGWGRALERYGVMGLVKELARTASGQGAWRFAIPRTEGLTGWEIEQLLARYGITIWGRWFDDEYLYFNVKREQANWAEYLLKRRGLSVASAPYNLLNDLYPQRHPPGSMPTPWQEKKRQR